MSWIVILVTFVVGFVLGLGVTFIIKERQRDEDESVEMEEEQCGATLNKKVTGKNIYVGNLSYDAKDGDLYQVFAPYGIVKSVRIVKDKFSGESRGFAFVEMATLIETQLAIEGLQGRDFKGRKLMVKEAHPRSEGRPQGRKRDLGKRGGGSRQGERHANRRSKERRI